MGGAFLQNLLTATKRTFTCLKSTKKTVGNGVKYVQKLQQRHQNDVNDIVLVSLLLTLNISQTFFYYFIGDFEQVNVDWVTA